MSTSFHAVCRDVPGGFEAFQKPQRRVKLSQPRKPLVQSVIVVTPTDQEPEQRGLGDVVKKVTSALGIPHCERCDKTRKKLNKLFPF